MQVVNLNQAEIISAFSSGTGLLAGVWAPNNYTLEQRIGAKTVCTGKDAGAVVPRTLVVRGEYAKEHPDLVARYLAVYLRSIAWQKKNPKETVEHSRTPRNISDLLACPDAGLPARRRRALPPATAARS